MTDSKRVHPVRPFIRGPRGTLEILNHQSSALRDNPWGDPDHRPVSVYSTPGLHRDDRVPVLWDLAAYTNSGPGHIAWRNHGDTLPERMDRLFNSEEIGPCRMVFPDCYTSLGGNQYVNSTAVGAYQDYLVEELHPFVADHFACGPAAVFGKSSGGYGALRLGMLFPQLFRAVACHAGDIGFEWVYKPDFPKAALALAPFKGNLKAFLDAFWRRRQPAGLDFHAILILGLAASYDPDEEAELGFRLPFDTETLQIDATRWHRWLENDPLVMLESHHHSLQSLAGLYLDVGLRDQYNILYGSRQFSQALEKYGVSHTYEEFDGTHSGIDFRLNTSLPYLWKVLDSLNQAG